MTIYENHFREAFIDANRENNFSSHGLGELFDYLMDYEDETGEQIELDVIALCCDFTEYGSLEELQRNYDVPDDFEEAREYLEQRTQVVCFEEDTIIIQNY